MESSEVSFGGSIPFNLNKTHLHEVGMSTMSE